MTTLAQFKTNIKYKLGYPVVQIELSTEQLDLAVHEAITFYQRNHFDGSAQMYMPIQIDATLKANKYVSLPDTVVSINDIFAYSGTGTGVLSTDFVMTADAAWTSFRSNGGLGSYYNMMSYRSMIQQMTVNKIPVRFNYNRGKCFIDMSDSKWTVGNWLVLDIQEAMDPALDTRMFEDPWLLELATNHVKRMWGQTLKKYQSVAMPGGIMLDGQTLYSEAQEQIEKMEEEVISKWQLPMDFRVG